jgi:soluble lytic murein transglycosylase
MKKLIIILSLSSINLAMANDSNTLLQKLNIAYTQHNSNLLKQLIQQNPTNNLIKYSFNLTQLQESANLDNFIPLTGYFANDFNHQLLTYYFKQQQWQQYVKVYPQIESEQLTLKEKCGFDLANYALQNKQASITNFQSLITNKIPTECISLLASKLNAKQLPNSYLNPFLYNLIINNQLSEFNQVAPVFKIKPLLPLTSSNDQNKVFQFIYQIKNLLNNDPQLAYTKVLNSNLDQSTKQFIYNPIATALALKQNYSLAESAINLASNQLISDNDYEWRVRTYLALQKWQDAFNTINNMPTSLQNKNVWLYWKAYTANNLKHKELAISILKNIPIDYSYYSLLAQTELKQTLNPLKSIPQQSINTTSLTDINFLFNLYHYSQQYNNNFYLKISTQGIKYLINTTNNDETLLYISQQAFKINWREIAILAANKLKQPIAKLSFPIYYPELYLQYSQENQIDLSYPIAITRQESRFNPNALASDGGVGLMQLMPNTANYIAKKLHSNNCYRSYPCNIKFGSWYLGHLNKKFGGNLIYASAAYNAGPGRAHRWQQSLYNLDNRIQIELIPFSITRDYVQKVLTNKIVYDALLSKSKNINLLNYLNSLNQHDDTFIIDDDNSIGNITNESTTNE